MHFITFQIKKIRHFTRADFRNFLQLLLSKIVVFSKSTGNSILHEMPVRPSYIHIRKLVKINYTNAICNLSAPLLYICTHSCHFIVYENFLCRILYCKEIRHCKSKLPSTNTLISRKNRVQWNEFEQHFRLISGYHIVTYMEHFMLGSISF